MRVGEGRGRGRSRRESRSPIVEGKGGGGAHQVHEDVRDDLVREPVHGAEGLRLPVEVGGEERVDDEGVALGLARGFGRARARLPGVQATHDAHLELEGTARSARGRPSRGEK